MIWKELFFQCFGWTHTRPILGPPVPLFLISGDVSSDFQSQSGFCLIRFFFTEANGILLSIDDLKETSIDQGKVPDFKTCLNWPCLACRSTHLSITLVASLVSLAQIEAHPIGVSLVYLLHQVQSPLTQCLSDRVKEHEYQVRQVSYKSRYRELLI